MDDNSRPVPSFGERVARALLDHPKTIWAGLAIAFAVSALILPGLKVDVGLGPIVRDGDPLESQLQLVNEQFVNDDNLFVVYQADDVFSPDALRTVRELGDKMLGLSVEGEDGKPLHAVAEIKSLATVRIVKGKEFDFENPLLVPDKIPEDAATLADLRKRAYANSLIRESLISEDGKTALLVVRVTQGLSFLQNSDFVAQVRQTVEPYAKASGISFYFTGKPVIEADEGRYTIQDLLLFLPLSMLISFLMLFYFTRRGLPVVMALVECGVIIVVSTAALVLFGGSLNSTTVMLPPIVAALCCAMSVHYFSELCKHADEARDETPYETAVRTMRLLFTPSLIAGATTAVGFAANAVSGIPAVRSFGLAVGVASLVSLITTNVLFALAARKRHADNISNPNSPARSAGLSRFLVGLGRLQERHHWALLGGVTAVIVVALAGIPRIEVGMDKLGAFHDNAPVRVATAVMEENIGGTTQMVVSIRHKDEEHFLQPDALRKLEDLRAFLESPAVGANTVLSFTDYVKLMHRGFFADDPKEERVPDSPEAVAQLLVVNGDPTVPQFIDIGRQWVRLMARAPNSDSIVTQRRFDNLDRYLAANFPIEDGYIAEQSNPDGTAAAGALSTSTNKLFSFTVNALTDTLLSGFGLAFLVIFAMLFLFFRSATTGLYSIPINVLPVITNLGIMGWFGIRLDAATVMVSSVCIGVAVDDSVHFLQYLRERFAAGRSIADAVRDTLVFKGPAVIGTSFILIIGTSVVLWSNFETTRHFGLLIGTGVFAALIGDLVVLPALVLCFKSRLGHKLEQSEAREAADAAVPSMADDDDPVPASV